MTVEPPTNCRPHFSLGVTGHREGNKALAENLPEVKKSVLALFNRIDTILAESGPDLEPVRFFSLLVDGVDQFTAEMALDRSWELVAPLPYGEKLNIAINARPKSVEDARRLLEGATVEDAEVEARANAIRTIAARAHMFQLADRDKETTRLFLDSLESPFDFASARAFDTQNADQVALAGQVMLERCDLLVAVWDGKVANLRGGTGHTVAAALALGTPVLVIDPADPGKWTVHTRPEELFGGASHGAVRLEAVITSALGSELSGSDVLLGENWRKASSHLWTFYRRIEAVFGGGKNAFGNLAADYEEPSKIVEGSGARTIAVARALPGSDQDLVEAISKSILPQFAWADGISSWLSDAYRSGMCFNFVLSALAVVIGAAYLPWDLSDQKWIFASAELLLLVLIMTITAIGSRRRWHGRWFETRRVAEYLRHGPIMLLLGVSRAAGRWPRGKDGEWPEQFARHSLRSNGLPRLVVSRAYLRAALETVLLPHVTGQREYHQEKADRLHKVDHRLDKLAEGFFVLAIISVSAYLLLKLASVLLLVPPGWSTETSKMFTFLGIAFPTLGASIAGIRFFGDFERFSAISQVAAEKLEEVSTRIQLLLAGPEAQITYGSVAELAHVLDEIVVDEIESWQAVFGGKHIALPA